MGKGISICFVVVIVVLSFAAVNAYNQQQESEKAEAAAAVRNECVENVNAQYEQQYSSTDMITLELYAPESASAIMQAEQSELDRCTVSN